jgi:hypothetical protein
MENTPWCCSRRGCEADALASMDTDVWRLRHISLDNLTAAASGLLHRSAASCIQLTSSSVLWHVNQLNAHALAGQCKVCDERQIEQLRTHVSCMLHLVV